MISAAILAIIGFILVVIFAGRLGEVLLQKLRNRARQETGDT